MYYFGIWKKQDIRKGIKYICRSAFNGHKQANFAVGFLFHDGKYYKKNIMDAIKYYKEASSFNNQYAKNNLGIIYKNGFENEIQPKLGLAKEYFKEAINQKNDKIAMYNLAHMYFYNDHIKEEFDPINLLIRSSNEDFYESIQLLCIILFKTFGNDEAKIIKRLNENEIKAKNISLIISRLIPNESSYETLYQYYKNIDFLYDISSKPIKSSEVGKEIKKDRNNFRAKEITSVFYEGFGIDI
ncbi:hypothetical protein M9Y10_008110 [Tritrichomonas musculus]|uniref:Uncharacterized protein n=1 Tax=Tritrichomonas musculus TaxID=1915356 RepID=A0ABR2IYC0_9EUKA